MIAEEISEFLKPLEILGSPVEDRYLDLFGVSLVNLPPDAGGSLILFLNGGCLTGLKPLLEVLL